MTSGCSPDIQSGGNAVADPGQPLQSALEKLKTDNNAGIQNNSITVSDETNCFYLKPNADADDVSSSVACGPVRRLGRPDDKVWDTYALKFGPPTDGKVTASIGAVSARAVAVDPSLLVSPDDVEPGKAADLPKPQAPQTSVSDRALALPSGAIPDLKFTEPGEQTVLKTPTATFTVTGVAQPRTVPSALVAGTDDPAGEAAYYRPAEGQRLSALTVKVSDPAEKDVEASTAAAAAKAQSLSTVLSVGVAGGKPVPIGDASDPDTDPAKAASTLTVGCQGAEDSFPCRPAKSEFMIVMSVPDEGAVTLAATSAGKRQAVDLQNGQLSSTVSQVDYQQDHRSTEIDRKLKVPGYVARVPVTESAPPADSKKSPDAQPDKTEKGDKEKGDKEKAEAEPTTKKVKKVRRASWSMKVDSAALSAFDPTRGWAPGGKAWLVVKTSHYNKSDHSGAFADRRAASVAVSADGTSYRPDGLTDADFEGADPVASDAVTWVFAVPEDLTAAEFTFRPTGAITVDDTRVGFTVDKPASAKIKFH